MLSNTSKYAIRAVIYLELYTSDTKMAGIREISTELGIPSHFLGKILQMLVKHQVLESAKGPHGGFKLKKPAIDISLMDIIEIFEGADIFDQCLIRTTPCSNDSHCSLHDKVSPYLEGLKKLLRTESIADLASSFRNGNEEIRI
ncbi:MAG: Rrf2 family transcriptional regulator [Bacteroidota bacterium]